MRWYSALFCLVPVMAAALGPNIRPDNFFGSPAAEIGGERHEKNIISEAIIIPDQESLDSDDYATEKLVSEIPPLKTCISPVAPLAKNEVSLSFDQP